MAKETKEQLNSKAKAKSVNKKKKSAKKNKISKNTSRLLIGLGIFIGSLSVLAVVLALILIPVLNNFAFKIGSTNFKEFVSLYKEVTKYVAEEEIVKYPFSSADYNNGTIKLLQAGADIFDSNANVDPEKFYELKDINFDEIEITDKELAALFENYIANYVDTLDIPIYKQLDLELALKEIKINVVAPGQYQIVIIGRLNASELAGKLGLVGGLIPKHTYVTTTQFVIYDGENNAWENISQGSIKINKVKEESLRKLLKILAKNIGGEIEDVDLDYLNDVVSEWIRNGINALSSFINGKIQFVQGGMRVTKNI